MQAIPAVTRARRVLPVPAGCTCPIARTYAHRRNFSPSAPWMEKTPPRMEKKPIRIGKTFAQGFYPSDRAWLVKNPGQGFSHPGVDGQKTQEGFSYPRGG